MGCTRVGELWASRSEPRHAADGRAGRRGDRLCGGERGRVPSAASNPGDSLLMPVMMKFTPIAATIRAITRVMTLMPVLPKNRSIRAAIHNVSPIKKVASTDAAASNALASHPLLRQEMLKRNYLSAVTQRILSEKPNFRKAVENHARIGEIVKKQRGAAGDDLNLHSLVHGVVRLEHYALQYGAERRRLRIFKMRGRNFRGGFHDFVIRKGGIALFPRLIAAEHADGMEAAEPLLSCIAELDALLGGGLDRGTSTLLMGPSGSGKSSLAMQFVMSALDRGERAFCNV
jgi:ABC-type uncharacterized transport system fused permease/ATPase subunit